MSQARVERNPLEEDEEETAENAVHREHRDTLAKQLAAFLDIQIVVRCLWMHEEKKETIIESKRK